MHLDDPSAKKRNDGVSQENFKFMAELLQQEIMANNHQLKVHQVVEIEALLADVNE